MHRAALLFAALIGLQAMPVAAAPRQPADRAAHRTAVTVLREASTRTHRRDWRTELPGEATAIPRRYGVTMVSAPRGWILHVERDGDRATAELVDGLGVRRGELPVAALDEWLRTTWYLERAVQTRPCLDPGTIGQTMRPYRTLGVRSRDPGDPFALDLGPVQPIHDEIGEDSDLKRVAHTWSARRIEQLFRTHLDASTLVPVDEALRREILARLESSTIKGRDRAEYGTAEALDSELAQAGPEVYGILLDKWRHRPAIDAIQKRGHRGRALHLDLVTRPEDRRLAALPRLLCGEPWQQEPARSVARELGGAAEAPLLAALRCPLDEYALALLVAEVQRLPPSREVRVALRSLRTRTTNARVLRAVDRALLLQVHDEPTRTRLTAAADRPSTGPLHKMSDEQRTALAILREKAAVEPLRRPALVALVRRVLASIPIDADEDSSGLYSLIATLAEFGGAGDLPAFRALLTAQNGPVVAMLIHAIARHDPAAAQRAIRRELVRYVQGEQNTSFAADAWLYLELSLEIDARAVVPALRRALSRMRREGPRRLDLRMQTAVLRYLSTRTEAVRVAQIYAYMSVVGELDPKLARVLRARHTLDETRMQQAIAAHSAWNPW